MPRFKIGDRVRIRAEDATPFAGLNATVRQIQPHSKNIAILDLYVVVFEWGEEHSFYDGQLTERTHNGGN